MLNRQEEERDRRETLRNDQLVREQQQGGTYLSHTHSDLGGRYALVSPSYVVGSTAIPQYPAASGPFQRDPVPDEPFLSACENPGFEPSTVCPVTSVEGHCDAVATPSAPLDVECAASPLSQTEPSRHAQRGLGSSPSSNSWRRF